jgi:hypothetical protein
MVTSKDNKEISLDFKHVKMINKIISEGERVEVVPTKDGVKIFKVVRREAKE